MAVDFSATPLQGHTPFDVAFTDLTNTSIAPSTWLWTFGDGSISQVKNPTHTYLVPGDFTVSLTVNTSSSTTTKKAYITVDSGLGVLLPELLLPSSLPPFLADGHSVQFVDIYGNVSWATGEDSKRMVYTSAPRIVSVSLDLSASQMTDFYNWFEGPGGAGAQWFSCLIANFGPGLLWCKARFSTPYIATPDAIGTRWDVKFNLYVLGEGQFTPPSRTSFVSYRGLLLEANATPMGDRRFSSSRSIPLDANNYALASQRQLGLS